MTELKNEATGSTDTAPAAPVSVWRSIWNGWIKPFLIVGTIVFTVRSAVADWNDVPTSSMKPTILIGDRIFVNKLAYDLKIPFTLTRLASWSEPKRGEIVVFFSTEERPAPRPRGTMDRFWSFMGFLFPQNRLVKRVVATPGDTIEGRDGRLIVNGKEATYSPLDRSETSEAQESEDPFRPRAFYNEEVDGVTHPIALANGASNMRSFPEKKIPPGMYFMMGDNRDFSNDSRYFGPVPMKQIVGRATAVALSVDKDNHYLPRWGRFLRTLR